MELGDPSLQKMGEAMTDLLQHAFNRASELSSKEQNALATWLLEELESEKRWDHLFANSADSLENLADEALAEHREGNTKTMNSNEP